MFILKFYLLVMKYNSTSNIPTTDNAPSHQVKIRYCCNINKKQSNIAINIPCLKLIPIYVSATSSLPLTTLRIQVKKRMNNPERKSSALAKKRTCPTIPVFSGSTCFTTKTQAANEIAVESLIPQRYDFSVIYFSVFTLLNCTIIFN